MQLGLVTYLWGAQWDLPTLLKNCRDTGFEGVELRSTHKHGVEPTLDEQQRVEVAMQIAASGVTLVGLGSACDYHSPDPAVLKKNIDETKAFIHLCHDLGGGGVKVRPNALPKEVPVEKTIEQIGRSYNEVAEYGERYGVELRMEIHGHDTQQLPVIAKIMSYADCPNAKVCWNCNPTDTDGEGLRANFAMVADRIGTVHIHDLSSEYPWKELFGLLKMSSFDGWTLLEEKPPEGDIVEAMKKYRKDWERMVM